MQRITECVFITGTNAVGKSSLSHAILERQGGIERFEKDVTYTKNGVVSFAGPYFDGHYQGVDRIRDDKGHSCTSRLAEVVREGLTHSDIIICEGSFMNTFGLNLTNAMFSADRYLVVSLYCDKMELYRRLQQRNNGHKTDYDKVFKKQLQALRAARKWQRIGVRVLQYCTSSTPLDQLVAAVEGAIFDNVKQ